MAVFSEVALSDIESARRIDAEFFRPEYLANSARLDELDTVALRSIATVRGGFPWKASEFLDDGGEPVIRIRDIRPRVIDPSTLTGLAAEYVAQEQKRVAAEAGELVVGMDGLDYLDFRRFSTGQAASFRQCANS